MKALKHISLILATLVSPLAHSQCLEFYDSQGVLTDEPYWISCSGSDFNLVIQSPNTIGAFSIDWGDGSPVTAGLALIPPQNVQHLYAAVVDTFVVTITEISTGCVITGVVVMEEYASASIQIPINTLTQVCAPEAIQFTNSSTDVSETTTFTWDFGDDTQPLVFDHTNWGQTISHTYQQGTVSCETQVVLTADNYCNTLGGGPSIASFNPLRVWDIDTAAISASATLLCYPDTIVDFQNVSIRNCFNQGNIAQRYEYWNFGDYWGTGQDSIIDWTPWPPAPVHTIAYPGIGTYQVMMLDSNYCGIDTAYMTIQIVPPPSVQLTSAPDTVCVGEDIFLNQTTNGGANAYAWDFGEGAGWQATGPGDRYYAFSSPGTFTVSYQASISGATAGCADTASTSVVVIASPTAAFTMTDSLSCDPLLVGFTDVSLNANTHSWNFGNGNSSVSASPPNQSYVNANTYDVSLVVTNVQGCSDTAFSTVQIFNPPIVSLVNSVVCRDELFSLSPPVSVFPGDSIVTYDWNMGDGTVYADSAIQHAYSAPGNYQVILSVNGLNCSSSDTATIQVMAPPTALFAPDTTIGCSPLSVNFANGATGFTSSEWFIDGLPLSSAVNATYVFTNPTNAPQTHQVSLVVENALGCTDTSSVSIVVQPEVDADFTYTGTIGCAPLDLQFNNASSNATNYTWDFGDGSTSTVTNPQHTFVNTSLSLQIFTVTLTAFDSISGCASSFQTSIQVYPTANFTFTPLPDSGCSPLFVDFPVVLGAVSYDWDFGDGTTGQGAPMQHTFQNNGIGIITYDVVLITANAFGCTDTVVQQVVVFPGAIADFTASPNIQQLPNATVSVANTGSNGADFFYLWDFGDGTTSTSSQPLPHTYGGAGVYDISLIVTNGFCTDTAYQQVEIVEPDPIPSFTGAGIGCAPVIVDFVSTTVNVQSYYWQFGDGNTSTLQNPSHIYTQPGTYFPSLTTIGFSGNPQTVVSTDSVVVYPNAIAAFTAQPTLIIAPDDAVHFYNLSSNADTYLWEFGDGISSGADNPIHFYSGPGTYDVTLIANNAYNCPDTFLMANAVLAQSAGELEFPNAFTPNSNGQTDGAYDPNSFDNDFFFPLHEGVTEYHLQVFNRWGELVFESFDVHRGWDGYYKGKPAKQDVYVWKAFAKFSSGNQVTQSGDLTLLR